MVSIDTSKLDLAFVLDTTSSMGAYIQYAKNNINKIADELIKSEKCHLRIGLVNYRDHPPEDRTYVTKIRDLTDDIDIVKNFINKTGAGGGGDGPESVCCGLKKCLDILTWRNDAVKVAILIADAPPHGLGGANRIYDGFPDGCPIKNDPVEIAHKMAEKGITLYCAGCEPSINPYRQFFVALCLITGGQYVSLNNANNLTNVIVGGTREEISMEKLMAQVHNEFMKEAAEKGKAVDEDELTKRIHQVLNSKKDSSNFINKLDSSITVEITDEIKSLSKIKTLSELTKYANDNNINLTSYSPAVSYSFPTSTFLARTVKKIKPTKKIPLVKTSIKITKSRRAKSTLAKSIKKAKFIAEGPRRSSRLIELEKRKKEMEKLKLKNEKKFSKLALKRTLDEDEVIKNLKTKKSKAEIKEDEEKGVTITYARRMAKKTLARNNKPKSEF